MTNTAVNNQIIKNYKLLISATIERALCDLHGHNSVVALDALDFFCDDVAQDWLKISTGILLEPDEIVLYAIDADKHHDFSGAWKVNNNRRDMTPKEKKELKMLVERNFPKLMTWLVKKARNE